MDKKNRGKGQPSPWISKPIKVIRLPEKYHKELKAVAHLLDTGAIFPVDLLLIQSKVSQAPTLEKFQALILSLSQAIAAAEDNLTAVEMGLLVASLESAAKEVDQIFTKKAKAEALESIAIVNEQKQTEENS